MLRISNYGIVLRELTVFDLETVRRWRNSDHISTYMAFQGHITRDMQREWFEEIDARGDKYFIIHYNNKDIGVTGFKRRTEAHGFIYDPAYQNSHVAYRSAFCLYDYYFDSMERRFCVCKIRQKNTRSIAFNKSLGYVLSENEEYNDDQLYTLYRDVYFEKTARFKKLLK